MSGFPEWLPAERMVEQYVLDTLRDVFELYGFAPVETRAVEPLEWLTGGAGIDKEIYAVHRAIEEGGEAELGLRFDLTVPTARYVLENAGRLVFPLRRYQISKVWRGERPQEGRFREFIQADIDVIGDHHLPNCYETELPLIIGEALSRLPVPPARIRANNRKIAEGFYLGLGIENVTGVLRMVDKLDKIGLEEVHNLLVERVGCTQEQATRCLDLAQIVADDASFADQALALGVRNELLVCGLDELTQVVEQVGAQRPGLLVADLGIARGLDYYTGTVYETQLHGADKLGSICSGGRYDNLATEGDVVYPGVGISIGVTRLLSYLFSRGMLRSARLVPTCVLVALPADDDRARCNAIAGALRGRGIPTEVAPEALKYGRQIRYAARRGIPFVWFPKTDTGEENTVRDIRSGEQVPAEPDTWTPPDADVRPRVLSDFDRTPAPTG